MARDPETLREVIEFLDQGVALFDADAKLSFANDSFRDMYPALPDMLAPGTPWGVFLHEAVNRGAMPQPVSQLLNAIEARLDHRTPVETVQMPADVGATFTLRLAQTSDGGFVLTQSTGVDHIRAADTAREAEQLLRKVLEACPTSLTMSRVADGQIIYRSPAATNLLGTSKSSFSHFAHVEERADFVTALLPDARVDNMRVTCLRANGQAFPADLSARLIDYRGEDVIVANIEDLTEELAVRAELDRQKEQLFQSEKLSALGELLAGVSHELNNPLSIIVGNADILHEELENTGLEKRISKLSQAAHRCVRIVRSFLSLARQEPLDLRPMSPSKLIETAKDVVSAEAGTVGVQVHSNVANDCPDITVDEVQLTQVIINLLTNAIHAIRDASIGDRVTIDCDHDDDRIRFTISDNGPGVPDAVKTRIFDPLFTTKEVGKGTGVGLAYSHRIVSAHKGRIQLATSSKQGATFIVELPLAHSL
ncbi:MAG: ATP-binding protein [Pseudomonadota bacterium]